MITPHRPLAKENNYADSYSQTDNGVVAKNVVVYESPPTDPTKLNSSTVISGLSVIGDNLTITDTIDGINYRFTTTWTGTGPYTCTVSAVVIV